MVARLSDGAASLALQPILIRLFDGGRVPRRCGRMSSGPTVDDPGEESVDRSHRGRGTDGWAASRTCAEPRQFRVGDRVRDTRASAALNARACSGFVQVSLPPWITRNGGAAELIQDSGDPSAGW